MGAGRNHRVKVALLVLCAVVGVVIVVSLVNQQRKPPTRTVVVKQSLRAATVATSRYAVTRPFQLELIDAIVRQQRAKAVELLERDPLLVKAEVQEDGFATPLHYTAFHLDTEVAQMMLDAGADLEARELKHDGTPLEWAVYAGRVDMVKYLLAKGAKVDDVCLIWAQAGTQRRAHLTTQPAVYREIQKMLLAEVKKGQ